MATTSRQTSIFGVQDWRSIYKTFNEADFQSYNFETLRKSFVDYLEQFYPENFNDFVESSEFIALIDLMAFMGQSLSYRTDLNTRENFIDTAERRDSVIKLANLVGYTPKRNETSTGFLKVDSISTTENVFDFNNNSLANVTIRWFDQTNPDWQEQFTAIINAMLVSSQSIGRASNVAEILGITHSEYTIKLTNNLLPAIPFTSTVDDINMTFEAIHSTSVNDTKIYEPAPRASNSLNVLYRDDHNGFGSTNTGYFFYFKQGVLDSRDFTVSERIANRTINVDIEGINNSDVWLYQVNQTTGDLTLWEQVESVFAINEQSGITERQVYSITSRSNDQISLVFGDGVFGEIPSGSFRVYVRSGNGLDYVINPENISSVSLTIPYISRTNKIETVTFNVSLQQNISNSESREDLDDIKLNAPARFYTQNRMVNGEDYNNFPYTQFSSIIKSKAINRSSVGVSRYLDLVDPTGKFSSINIFGNDGLIYEEFTEEEFTFTFVDNNDIETAIVNQLEPILGLSGSTQFYYDKFTRPPLNSGGSSIDMQWDQISSLVNETTGYFTETGSSTVLPVGSSEADNKQFIVEGALIRFEPPVGQYFDKNNKLQSGVPLQSGDRTVIWASVINLDGNGAAVNTDGTGPVTLNSFVPTNAIPTEVVSVFNVDLSFDFKQEMLQQIELFRNFGIGYDNTIGEWYIINSDNLDTSGEFSDAFAKDTSNTNKDASWIAKFIATNSIYTVSARLLKYFFASVLETRFFFDSHDRIFDASTGHVISDTIYVLKTNTKTSAGSEPLLTELAFDIIGQPVEADGYINNHLVEVSLAGIADHLEHSHSRSIHGDSHPDSFTDLVNTTVSPTDRVFSQRTVDADNLEKFIPLGENVVNEDYTTEISIEDDISTFEVGQLFYATTDDKFFEVTLNGGDKILTERTDIILKVGRDGLQFRYNHNSGETHRINPGITNIIDIFLVTSSYHNEYKQYLEDSTDTITEPEAPTIDELTIAYQSLDDFKMLSDNIVLNSAVFKTLFGDKSEDQLRAFIKIVKDRKTLVSDNEIKSRVIAAINEYFDIDNWDFGDTFFFSELSAFLHNQLGDIIGSVVLVPKDPSLAFGELYEVRSQANEIFVSSATVNDVVVINSLTTETLGVG